MKDNCIDGLMIPPISKQYNSTEASAKEMLPWAQANLIHPLQRIISRQIRREVYMPLLMGFDYSVKLCPELSFESPDADRDEVADYYSKLVQAEIMPPQFAARELGFEEEYLQWQKERREEFERNQQMFNQQSQQREDAERVREKVLSLGKTDGS